MKKLILIISLVLPFLANGQDYRVVDWKTDVLNVQTVGIDTFKFDAEPKDYNDAGAITREIGNYFIDFVARCFKIIGSDETTITVVDLEHINSAPQSNQIGRVYQSVVDADSLFESIGGVDISVLDQMSIYRDVARNNEIICRLLKELYLKDATYRQKTDHDSLSMLDEKSYNSLTDKPDLTSYRQKTDHDSLSALDEKSYNSLTDKPNLSVYLTSEVDGSTTNEIQDLSRAGNTLSLSGDGTTVDLSDLVNPSLTGYRLKTDHDSLSALDEKSYNSLTDKPTSLPASDVSAWAKAATKPTYTKSEVGLGSVDNTSDASKPISTATQTALNAKLAISDTTNKWQPKGTYLSFEVDGSTTNEIQSLSLGTKSGYTQPLTISGGNTIDIDVADNDNSKTNEIQNLSRTGNTLSLSGDATSVDLSDLAAPDLSGYATTTQLANQLSQTISNGITTKSPSEDAVYDALTGKATVSGTTGYLAKITGANTLGNSLIQDNGTAISIGLPVQNNNTFQSINNIASVGASESGSSEIGAQTYGYWSTPTYTGTLLRQYGSSYAGTIAGITAKNLGALIFQNTDTALIYANGLAPIIMGTYSSPMSILNVAGNYGVGTLTPAARVHSQSTTTQLRLGYDATKYTDLSTNSAGTFNISPSGGFTAFSGGISASAFSTFTGQVEMTGLDVNLGASTVLRKNGSDVFTAPITMGACGSAGQVLSSTGPNSAPTWTTPATGSGSGITSIGMQVPTGLTVSPSALTSNGTFTIGLQSGYSIPTTANQTNWSTAYTNRITSAVGTTPLALSISNNTLSGYLSWTLTNINNATPAVGYLYYNGSTYSYQAATTTYTLPTASSSTLGGVKINGNGMAINAGGVLFQEDNNLTTRTPEVTDYIAFYDNSATAQGKMTLSTLGTLIGTSGGMVYPGAGIPVSTGSIWGTSKTAPSGAIVGTTDSQALTNKSVNGVTLSTIQSPTRFLRGDGTYERINVVQTLTSASSITMDIWNGSKAVLALATNSTITITNVPDGGEGSIEVTNSGAYTLAIAGSTGYTSTQKMGTVSAIASSAHTTVFYWRSGSTLYYGFLLNN